MEASTFFTLGLIIAVSLVIEAILLLKNQGKITGLIGTTTTIEFLWFLVCIYALFGVSFPSWGIIIPIAYLIYFVVALWSFRDFGKDIKTLDDTQNLRIPLSFAKVSLTMGLLLFLLNATALWQLS